MANQENLVKIGQEGFSVMEDLFGQAKMLETLPEAHENRVKKSRSGWRKSAASRTIDCNQAAKKYGGVVILDATSEYRT